MFHSVPQELKTHDVLVNSSYKDQAKLHSVCVCAHAPVQGHTGMYTHSCPQNLSIN